MPTHLGDERIMSIELQAARDLVRFKSQRLAHVTATAGEVLDGAAALTSQRLRTITESALRLPGAASADELLGQLDELQTTLNHLLDIGRARLGILSLWRTRHELAAELRQVCEALAVQGEMQGIDFQASIPAELPRVYCDCEKVRQVVSSLVANAFFYVERGGAVRLWARAAEDGRHLLVGVSDDGTGIDQEELNQMWQASERASLATALPQHAFGLAVRAAREMIERNLGQLHVTSGEQGSDLVLRLPMDDPATLLGNQVDYVARQSGHSPHVCLLTASTLSADGAALADELLQRSLRGDLVYQVTETSWRLAVNCSASDLPDLLARLHGAWTHARNNPVYRSLAPLQLETLGSWDFQQQREELIVAFTNACSSPLPSEGDLRVLLLDADQEFVQGLSSRLESADYDIVGQRPAAQVGELIADYPHAAVLDLRTGARHASEPMSDEAAAVIMLARRLRGQQSELEREARSFWQPHEPAAAW